MLQVIDFQNKKPYTVENCMVDKAIANCGAFGDKTNHKKKLWQSVQRVPVVFI